MVTVMEVVTVVDVEVVEVAMVVGGGDHVVVEVVEIVVAAAEVWCFTFWIFV